jgi:CheY-like chemotaxis protein
MKGSILVVDDNTANATLVSYLLSRRGFEVRIAVDAEQALASLEEFKPQLIMMDIQLPGMDGLALTRRLKADPRFSDIIVIALTAYAMKGDEERTRAAGCDGYVSKPIDTRTLPGLIAEFMGRAGLQQNPS